MENHMKQRAPVDESYLKSAEHFKATSTDMDGGEYGSLFVIRQKGIRGHAKRIRKALPDLDKETAEKCAKVYCQLFVEDVNQLMVELVEQATVIAMKRIAIDVANLSTKFAMNLKQAEIKRAMKQQAPKPKKKRKRKLSARRQKSHITRKQQVARASS
jgi:hypothetical protein